MMRISELDTETKEKIDSVLRSIHKIAREEGKPSIFTIANTKKHNNLEIFFPPIRQTKEGPVGNVVVYTVEQAAKIGRYLDGKVEIILVDAEKKIFESEYGEKDVGNIERTIFEIVHKSKIYSFKANDLTVSAVDCFISQIKKPLSGKNIAIIGAGNIGSKLALTIVERGVNVRLYRRNTEHLEKIVHALNLIKTGELISEIVASESATDACKDADVIIGCTPGNAGIDQSCISVAKRDCIIIDVGKGSLSKDAITYALSKNMEVIRADVRAGFEGILTTIFSTIELINGKMGKQKEKEYDIISGGIMGKEGDIVVDNFRNPRQIVGIANGKGDLKRKLNQKDAEKLEKLKGRFSVIN